MSTSVVLWSVFLGALGMAYMSYAKRQGKTIAAIAGIIFILLPYFTTETYHLLASLIVIVALVYFFNY